jgi:hypothetical protein
MCPCSGDACSTIGIDSSRWHVGGTAARWWVQDFDSKSGARNQACGRQLVENLSQAFRYSGCGGYGRFGQHYAVRDSAALYHGVLGRYNSRTPVASIIAKNTVIGGDHNGTIVVPG